MDDVTTNKITLKFTITSIIVAPPVSYITKISRPDNPAGSVVYTRWKT
jgi:hypothetical protein